MGLYLYGVTRSDNAPGPTLAGMGGREVRLLELAGLAVWAEEMQRMPEASLESVREHHRVVEAAAGGGPVLPLRFGQWVPGAEAVEETLARRRSAYEDALDRVEGAVELGIRIVDPDLRAPREPAAAAAAAADQEDAEPRSPGRGRAYLEALRKRERTRAERRRRGDELARELSAELGSLLRGERIEGPSGKGDLVTLAHLIRLEDRKRHEQAVRGFRERHPRLRVVASGPWPPYSFTPGEEDPATTGEDGEP